MALFSLPSHVQTLTFATSVSPSAAAAPSPSEMTREDEVSAGLPFGKVTAGLAARMHPRP